MGDVEKLTKHPAKFSDPILELIGEIVARRKVRGIAFDPFAGIGRIHRLRSESLITFGVELEEEWARQSIWTECGDVLKVGTRDAEARWEYGIGPGEFDAVITSPCYGNRMADHHEAKDGSTRHTYRHYLGRPLTEGSAGGMQWGAEYRAFHIAAWKRIMWTLRVGGLVVLNVSDHVRKGQVQKVADWHKMVLKVQGVVWLEDHVVETRRQRHGENGDVRVDGERVMVGMKTREAY